MTKIKFCGLTREQDVDAACALGVEYLGFVRHRQSARYVTLARAKELASRLQGQQAVLVHRWQSRPDRLESAWYQAEAFGSWTYWPTDVDSNSNPPRVKVFRADPARRPGEILEGCHILELKYSQAFLVDAFVPGVGGGTGVRVDLGWAEEFASLSRLPLFLAGGLNPDTVTEAIRRVQPFAVDVSTGIESAPGVKDPGKMRAFVEAVRTAQ